MNKSLDKNYRSSSPDRSAHARPVLADIEQERIYQQTKDEILFWSKKLHVSPSQLFTLPEDHLDELLAAAYEETLRNDMHQEHIKRMQNAKRLEEIEEIEEFQRQEELQKYEHMKRLNDIQLHEEIQLQQKNAHLDDYEEYQRQEELNAFAHMKHLEEFQRQEELERQKELQRLEKIQIQQVLQEKQRRREQRMERLRKLSQIKNQFIEQQNSRLKGGGQLNGRSAWEILHDAALEIEASYGPLGIDKIVGGAAAELLPTAMSDNSYVENIQSLQTQEPFEESTFRMHNAKFDMTLPKT